MAKRQVVVGLIGAGRIGKMHAGNMISYLPDIFLKAVADPKLDEKWAENIGIPVRAKDASVFLKDKDIEAVVIAASTTTHVELIQASALAGKHIFCEKPIAFEPEDVVEAVQATERAGVKLQVGFNRRFDPNFRRAYEFVQSGKIGTIHIIKITNRDPARPDLDFIPQSGGLFIDFSIHDFDMARFITESEVEEIYAIGTVLIDPKIKKLGDIDTALITIKMTNGALCVIDNSRETHYGYDQQVEVFGSKGCINVPNTTPSSTTVSTADGVFVDKPHYSFIERYQEAFISELREFFNCVRDDRDPPVSGKDALAAVKIAEAAIQSHNQNSPVRLEI